MSAVLWMSAAWWGLANRSGPRGFEVWTVVDDGRADPSYIHYVAKRLDTDVQP